MKTRIFIRSFPGMDLFKKKPGMPRHKPADRGAEERLFPFLLSCYAFTNIGPHFSRAIYCGGG